MDQSPVRRSLYELSRPELRALMERVGEPDYRAAQIWRWLYRSLSGEFEQMTNLPRQLRDRLQDTVRVHTLTGVARTDGQDGCATKLLLRAVDGQLIETVLMHYVDRGDEVQLDDSGGSSGGRHTVCLSTQAGCAMGCVFCATGQMGLVRDLSVGECVEQFVTCARELSTRRERISNVVFMGMGEPLANWPATWGTVRRLTDPDGLAMSPRRITISTVGIVPGIRRLAETKVPVRLAVSLHAAGDAVRSQLVPINQTYGIADIVAACRYYQSRTGKRITIECALIDGVNDGVEDARALARLVRGLHVLVNLIPLNPTDGCAFRPSRQDAAERFRRVLTDAGLPATLRLRRGTRIGAGCGQLRTRAANGRVGRTVKARLLISHSHSKA